MTRPPRPSPKSSRRKAYRNNTVDYKVRDAEVQKIPYIIVIGDKEEKAKTLAVRERGRKVRFGVKYEDFVRQVRREIDERA